MTVASLLLILSPLPLFLKVCFSVARPAGALDRVCACMPPALCGVLARLWEANGSVRLCGAVGTRQAGKRVASWQRLRSKMEADMHVRTHRSTMRGSSRSSRMSKA